MFFFFVNKLFVLEFYWEKRFFFKKNIFRHLPISTFSINHWYNYLCYEYQSAAFLMENDSDRWQIACVWNGNDANGTCAPAPSNNSPITYIEPEKWQQMLHVS